MTDFDLIAAERRALADEAEGFTAEQWATPSLCGDWTVHDVVAHLTVPIALERALTARLFVKHRFDAVNVELTARRAERSNAELIALLRDNADATFTPPGAGSGAPLTDVIVHGQDIRRPLGSVRVLPAEALATASGSSPAAGRGFMPKGRNAGLHFEATDIDWRHGRGPTVRGPAVSLAMALTGRAIAFPDLDGDGVGVLRGRP